MHVVGCNQLDVQLARDLDQQRIDVLLIPDSVILQLDIVVLPEQVLKLLGKRLGVVVSVGEQQLRDLPRKAGREAHDPLRVLLEQLHVDPGLVVETVCECQGVQLDDVLISPFVLCQQHQMEKAPILGIVALHVVAHVELTTDDGLDSVRLGLLVKFKRSEHVSVIGDCHGREIALFTGVPDALNARRTVQQAVFGMKMQMYERFHGTPYTYIRPNANSFFE